MGALQTDILIRRAQQAHAQNNLTLARQLCEQVLRRDGKNGAALFMLGQIAFA